MDYANVDYSLGCRGLYRAEKVPMNNKLKDLRTEHGWSQVEMGKRLDVSRQTIIALESGKYDPSLPLAFSITALFGLKIEDIFFPD